MNKWVNGELVDMTTEEIAAQETKRKTLEAAERTHPLTSDEVTDLFIRQKINTIEVDDQTALRMIAFYPEWYELVAKSYTAEKVGFKFVCSGKLYKTRQEKHTFSSSWVPGEGTESIYERIDEVHDGTKYDPIPYDGNMALVAGKYYIQDYMIYLCNRDTGNPVYNPLAELVGLYVVVAE